VIITSDQETEPHEAILLLLTLTKHLIGDATKNKIAMNLTNTVFDAKFLTACGFDDSVG
jgi:hypothetical protein